MRKKVLVVEDNAELLDLLRLHLKAAGFAVATATDGIEALTKARSVSPDLVLLDLGLPELDGLAVYETLRHTPETAAMPIVVVSGLPDGPARYGGLTLSACEFVSKPFNPKHLVARIKDLLRKTRGASAAPGSERTRPPEAALPTAPRAGERRASLVAGSRSRHGQPSAGKGH